MHVPLHYLDTGFPSVRFGFSLGLLTLSLITLGTGEGGDVLFAIFSVEPGPELLFFSTDLLGVKFFLLVFFSNLPIDAGSSLLLVLLLMIMVLVCYQSSGHELFLFGVNDTSGFACQKKNLSYCVQSHSIVLI